jgi:membrane protein YdbS with pleckstrin-like domain
MLTKHEKDFVEFWEKNRGERKKIRKQLFAGLPFGVLLIALILASSLSGWYRRAEMVLNVNASLVLVILIASVLIVAFIVIFSVRHRWEIDEQRYQELISRKKKEGA